MMHALSQWWDNRPSACRRRRQQATANYAAVGLTDGLVRELAEYNGRCSRGVVHTPQAEERMADLQERFDRVRREGTWS